MTSPRHDERPWGRYTVLGGSDRYQIKEIVVASGKRLSYQRHAHRSERWFVVAGAGRLVLDGGARDVGVGDAVDVGAGELHRLGNSGPEPLAFVEVQVGDYPGEDDIQRVDDDFGRA